MVWLVVLPLSVRLFATPVLKVVKKAGINIVVEKPRLYTSVLPNIKLAADDVKLLNEDTSAALEIKYPKINLRVLPLLSGRIHINSLECVNIFANTLLDDKLYIGKYPIDIKQNDVKLKIKRIKINGFNIVINEVSPKNLYELSGENIYFKNARNSFITHGKLCSVFNSEKTNADFDVRLPHRKNLKKTKFNINIDNLNLSQFSDIINRCVYSELISMSGNIDLHTNTKNLSMDLENLKICFKDSTQNIIFPNKFCIKSDYKIGENSFKIKKYSVSGGRINLDGNGYIKEIFSGNPYIDMNINMPESDIREGALLLPPVITPDINIPKLKQYPFYGNISGKMRIKGRFPEPDITGNVKVTDGVLIKPIPNASGGANINIDLIGKQLLLDVIVPAGGREVVYVSGDIALYGDKFAHLNIRSSQNVDLALAEFVVNPLHEIFCFVVGPVPIMEVTGKGNIDIKIVGTKKDPHIWGDFNFKNANARFLEVNNLVLKNADGNLNFNNQNAHFINNTGTLHGQPATIDGTCTLFGNLDFDVKANNQNLSDLYLVLTTSPMLEDIKTIVPEIRDIKGKSDFYLHLKGKLIDIADLKINENVIPQGYIKLLGNSLKMDNIPVNGIKGIINYDKKDCDFDINALISSASISKITGSIKDNIADIKINSPKICVNELEPVKLKHLDNLFVKLNAHYKGSIEKISIKGIDAFIEVIKDYRQIKNNKILSCQITLKNSNLKIANLTGIIKQKPFNANISISNIGDEKLDLVHSRMNGFVNCKDFDLTALNYLIKTGILAGNGIEDLEFKSGKATVYLKAHNNRIESAINVSDVNIEYLYKNIKNPIRIPFNIKNGQININNNIVTLSKVYCLIEDMPVLIYGKIKNFYSNPQYNLRINSKLVQKTFDKYWNLKNIYPIKINGDIVSSTGIDGNINNLRIREDIKMEPDSGIYYMGATLGDKLNPVTINIDSQTDKNGWIKLNKFNYNKIITSQNKKNNVHPILSVKGFVKPQGKTCLLRDLAVKTDNPANADLFNIIFKKPTIKSGNFTSDLVINGIATKPKIIGTFYAKNIEMPYLNTSVKDVNVNFKQDNIQLTTKGRVLDNYIMFNSVVKNNLNPPYKVSSADIYINEMDLDDTLNQIKQVELSGLSSAISPDNDIFSFKILNSLILNNVKFRAGNVKIKNIKASNLEATCALNDKMNFSVDSLKFNMASGAISGKIKYNLINNNMHMELNSKGVNANELTIALFDLPNQIYGSLTGHIELDCDATDDKTRLKTLNGYGTFNVNKGRMPKLGSLEYLLKAGNFIKGGITGLTMNGVLEILTPIKTGEFSSIDGRIRIKDGIAKTIEIRTIGKGLSLYVIGGLNLYTQIADMHIYGQLSKPVSKILGAAGNISLNTLFNKIPGISLDKEKGIINDLNKIPGIELSNKSNRRFMVEIFGDVGGDSFVKSFKWIN